jgi:hypothetical protein
MRILIHAGIEFPYTEIEVINLLVKITIAQNEKRDSGGEVQKFFDVMHHLVITGVIDENIHYKINANNLEFNLKNIYGYYSEWHRKLYGMAAPSQSNLRDKLKVHPSYSHYEDSTRVGAARTSVYVFKMDLIGVDLIEAKETRKQQQQQNKPMQQSYNDKLEQDKKQLAEGDSKPF